MPKTSDDSLFGSRSIISSLTGDDRPSRHHGRVRAQVQRRDDGQEGSAGDVAQERPVHVQLHTSARGQRHVDELHRNRPRSATLRR